MSKETEAQFTKFQEAACVELTKWMETEPDILKFARYLTPAGQEAFTALLAGAFTAGAKAVLKITSDEIALKLEKKS